MDARDTSAERRPEQRASFPLPAELHRRVGQMVMVGFRGMTAVQARPVMRHIANGLVGSVVLYDMDAEFGGPRNFQSREQVRNLITALKGMGDIPVLVALDAEGGFYHRLKEKFGFALAFPAAEMGERNDLQFTRMAAGTTADELADIGVDINLAPVLDLLNPSNLTASARRRAFSADPAVVAAQAGEFILAHREKGILTTCKHFPGMGGLLRPYMPGQGEVIADLAPLDLEPYRLLIDKHLVDAVLATRVTHTDFDPDFPGCLSHKTVTELLRGSLGFDGVVFSDAMEMPAIWEVFGFERGTILAVNAGVDILIFCNQSGVVPYDEDRGPAVVRTIVDAVERGEIPEARINEACARVLALKARVRRQVDRSA
jgi:beta-N-acetylhexosaminidase